MEYSNPIIPVVIRSIKKIARFILLKEGTCKFVNRIKTETKINKGGNDKKLLTANTKVQDKKSTHYSGIFQSNRIIVFLTQICSFLTQIFGETQIYPF